MKPAENKTSLTEHQCYLPMNGLRLSITRKRSTRKLLERRSKTKACTEWPTKSVLKSNLQISKQGIFMRKKQPSSLNLHYCKQPEIKTCMIRKSRMNTIIEHIKQKHSGTNSCKKQWVVDRWTINPNTRMTFLYSPKCKKMQSRRGRRIC